MTPKTEAELCDALTVAAVADGWDVYPEVAGWDLLLVWNGTMKPARWRHMPETPGGYQIAIEAKLRGNCDVIEEALSRAAFDLPGYRAPDEVAVLVPKAGTGFRRLCQRLGLRVLTLRDCTGRAGYDGRGEIRATKTPRTGPRLAVPVVALQGSGGQPAPRTMSKWRIAALRLCILLRDRGFITGADFKAQGIGSSQWTAARWIDRDGSEGRFARYVAGPRLDAAGPEVGYLVERDVLAAHDAERAA